MNCSCGSSTQCVCEDVCHCCPDACMCKPCYDIRSRIGGYCRYCGGYISNRMCRYIPEWKYSGLYPYRDEDFFRFHPHLQIRGSEGRSVEGLDSEARDNLRIARAADPDNSRRTKYDYLTYYDSLIFPVDDTDSPPCKVSEHTSTEAKNIFHENSNFSSRKNLSDTRQLGASEMSNSIPRSCNHNFGESKYTESSKCEMPFGVPRCSLNRPEANSLKMAKSQKRDESSTPKDNSDSSNCSVNISKLAESQRIVLFSELQPKHDSTNLKLTEAMESEMLTMNDSSNCSVNIPKLAESQRIVLFSELQLKHDVTNLKLTEAMESGMLTMNDPGSSYSREYISIQESQSTDSVSFAISPHVDEYASDSLPLDSFPQSEFLLSQKSSYPLSISASLCDLPQPTCKLEYPPNALGTSETSPASNLPNLESLKVSDSYQGNKSRSSSESNSSIEILSDIIPKEASSESDSSYEVIQREASDEKLDESAINKSPRGKK